MPDFLTIGGLRRIVQVPLHRIEYAIATYGPEPVGRVGIARVWSPQQLPDVVASLRRTSERSRVAVESTPAVTETAAP